MSEKHSMHFAGTAGSVSSQMGVSGVELQSALDEQTVCAALTRQDVVPSAHGRQAPWLSQYGATESQSPSLTH